MNNIVFFNHKSDVGKTSLVYHIAWMLSEKGYKVLAVDLDPQANLTDMFLDDDKLVQLWSEEESSCRSIMASINPVLKGTGDIAPAPIESIRENLHLIPGDLDLSQFEDALSRNWPLCLDEKESAFRISTAFYRIIYNAAHEMNVDIVLTDVGPNLGAINRSALIAADYLVIPLAAGLYSLQSLRNLGPTLKQWRSGWADRLDRKPADMDIPLPSGTSSRWDISLCDMWSASTIMRSFTADGLKKYRLPIAHTSLKNQKCRNPMMVEGIRITIEIESGLCAIIKVLCRWRRNPESRFLC